MINVSNLIGGVVSIDPAVSQPVEALSWDITLGTAGTGLGQLILGKTSSSSDMVPEAVDHVGVVVYGYLYEYGDAGILKTVAPLQSNPKSKYPVFKIRSREKLGETEKSQKEFEDWVNAMNQTDFKGSSYNVVDRSCVVWGIKACQFLNVSYPENWDKVCNWAAENSKVAGIIGGSGIQSRKVQFKAQSAKAPKKLANYIKKKLKKKKKKKDQEDVENVSTRESSQVNGEERNEKSDSESEDDDESSSSDNSSEEDGNKIDESIPNDDIINDEINETIKSIETTQL